MTLRRVRIVLNEFLIEPFFSAVLVLICIFIFSCFIGINNISLGINKKLYDYSVKTGVATVIAHGDWDKLHTYTDDAGYGVYRVWCYVEFETLGFDSDYIDKNQSYHRTLSGNATRMFRGGTYELSKMNSCITTGNPYEYSDNEGYFIWLSEISAEYINAKVGEIISVNTPSGKKDAKIKGIYKTNNEANDSDLVLSDFYLSARFLPDFILFQDLEIIIPELNMNSQSQICKAYYENGFQTTQSDTFKSVLNIKLGIYLVAIFAGLILISLMYSMTKLYIIKRKGFYSIVRLWGLNSFSVLLCVFLFLQILYTVSFALAIPITPFVYDGVTNAVTNMIGNDVAVNVEVLDPKHFISYIIFTLCNGLAVLVNSKTVLEEDISDNLRMGAEG